MKSLIPPVSSGPNEAPPRYANSSGPVGFLYIDTTKFANGVHTIAWSVTDNQGRADGIGSRYFNIQNLGGQNVPQGGTSLIPQAVPLPRVRHGFDLFAEHETISPAVNKRYLAEVTELGRIEIDLGAVDGWLDLNGQKTPLPVGSILKDGTFYWLPGPGYFGTYHLAFTCLRQDGTTYNRDFSIHVVRRPETTDR